MSPGDAERFFRFLVDVPPARLWWQDAGAGVRPLTEHPLLAGEALTGPCRADHETPAAVVAELRAALETNGWRPDARILVAIDGEGRCVLTDGAHRACAALGAGLATVPACVVSRASAWWSLRYLLLAIGGGVPTLYQPVDHPDFAAWPCWRKDTGERARVIGDFLRRQGVRQVVDLACHTGALSRGLGRTGFSVRGLDTDGRAVEAAHRLAAMEGLPGVGFATCEPLPSLPAADAVVVLSLLNHHQTDGRDAEGREVFRRCLVAAPLVILDAPAPGDPVGGRSKFTDPAEVLAWCAAVDPSGRGELLAPRAEALQRTLLVWHRG